MKKTLITIYFTLALYSGDSFSMNWGELEKEIHAIESGESGNESVKLRFIEIMQTLVVFTKAMNKKSIGDSGKLFCMPVKGSMTLDQAISMVRHQAKQEKSAPSESVQSLMLQALEKQFPCSR